MLYRILTEDKSYYDICKLIEHHLTGATVYQGRGLWQGEWENSLIIETDADYEDVKTLAETIKIMNQQNAVMIQTISCENHLI